MSLPDVTPIASYNGNGATNVAYSFPFKVLADSHVKLYVDGVLSTDTITVTGAGNNAGVEVFTSVAYASDKQVTLRREVPFSQETDLVEGGRLREESLEDALDYGVMQAQQIREQLSRAIQVAPGSAASILPEGADATIGQDANGYLISRSISEQVTHLGIEPSVSSAVASAAAAAASETASATSATNAATSETNAATSATNSATSAAAAEASNVNASATLLDLSTKSFPTVRIGKKFGEPNINSDVTINFLGGGSLTLKASSRPYTEPNAINAQNVDVGYLIPAIIDIVNGDVTDAATGQDYGFSTGSTNVDNFTPITAWRAALATEGGSNLSSQADLTYYGSQQGTFIAPLPLEVKANADLDPPTLPFTSSSSSDEIIRIESLNLDQTGATSVSDEIHDAINATGDTPKTVIFPDSATFLCKNIRIPSNTTLELGGCKMRYGGTTPSNFQFSPENGQSGIFHVYGTEGSPAESVKIIGGDLQGSRSSNDWSTYAEEDAVQAAWVNDMQVIGTVIHDFKQDGLEFKGCSNSLVSSCFIYDCVDAAIEFRAGQDNTVANNHVLRCRNGFMYKPLVKSAGGTEDGQGYSVTGNTFECFGVTILNNWANNSRFLNNTIAPLDVTGQSGLGSVAILHEEHPTIPRATNTMEGIETSGNILRGDITNTFLRQVAPSGAVYAHNAVHRNTCADSCARFLQLTGVAAVSGNLVNNITASSNRFSILLTPSDSAIISGNNMPSGSISISPALTSGSSVTIDGNVCGSIISTGNHMTITDNKGSGVNMDPGVLSAKISGNKFTYSQVPVDIEADHAMVFGNHIETTGNAYVVRLKADNCTISSNRLVKGSGTQTVLEVFTGTSDNVITGNHVECGSSTGAGIKLFGQYAKVTHNVIEGGNQNIRVTGTGDNNDIIGNTCRNANYQNIDIQTGATDNILDRNTADGTGSGLSDSGTGTMLGSTSRGF